MKRRSTCAMIDASPCFLCFSSNPCELNRSKQTALCCVLNNIRPSCSAQKTARIAQPSPRNAKTPKSSRATDTDAYAKESLCESRSDETGVAARVGRSSGSAAAGGRPAPPFFSDGEDRPAPPQRAGVRLRRSGRASGSARKIHDDTNVSDEYL